MPSLQDVSQATDQLQQYAAELRSKTDSGDLDFGDLAELADQISEHADCLATMFEEVDEILGSAVNGARGRTSRKR